MIGIIDYHLNNLRSVQKAFEQIGAEAFISDAPAELQRAEKLVLPGVGAFGQAMVNLADLRLDSVVRKHVSQKKPLLGICLGMQLLFSRSSEGGEYRGLDLIHGDIRQFPGTVKVPHIGWNQIDIQRSSSLFDGVDDRSFVYFVHSYFAAPEEPVTIATTEYGNAFTSMVEKENIFGIQFHPEKSQKAGLRILKNFSMLS